MQSHNSHGLSVKKQRILKLLDKVQMQDARPLSPLEISQKTGLNHSTVKNYLRLLLAHRLIRKVAYGLYVSDFGSVIHF